ncbi:MAG: aminoacyl-tRNA hydrolase [Clostridia bacterium]|nr:aminoacyl-tRNA hydrolase [Clostridia bacterium]
MFFKSKKSAFDYLVAGLGNPGIEYAKTRHNAGFIAIDKLAKDIGCEFKKNKHNALFGEGNIGGNRVLLVKPQTYMNNSGAAVGALSSFYKIPTDKIIIMFDDISLDVGKIRIRRKGSAGGHNGIKDIIEVLGTEDIMRIKIGVGERKDRQSDLKNHVLGKIPEGDMESFEAATDECVKAVKEILSRGIDSAMNKFSR